MIDKVQSYIKLNLELQSKRKPVQVSKKKTKKKVVKELDEDDMFLDAMIE